MMYLANDVTANVSETRQDVTNCRWKMILITLELAIDQ